ncbi:hypothetical protein PG997_010099 [Apiospora hydei]|uniref:Uncharacterized protein n=1 Tax=Apiospora hydei TaxID=1337664 RepID=A0ABR1VW11_9PEZI
MGGRQRESAAWPECPDRCKSVVTEGPHRQPATGTAILGSDSGNGTCTCTCVWHRALETRLGLMTALSRICNCWPPCALAGRSLCDDGIVEWLVPVILAQSRYKGAIRVEA